MNATMTEHAMETREETVRGRVLHLLVVRVDVTNAMAIMRTREIDGITGGTETETRDMSIGRETGGMGRERILLTDNMRGNSEPEHQMSVKTRIRHAVQVSQVNCEFQRQRPASSVCRFLDVLLFLAQLFFFFFFFRIVYWRCELLVS